MASTAYINSRARGMKSRLLSRSEIEAMLDSGRIDQMGESLLKSDYETELAEALSRYQGTDAIEDAVSRNLVATFAKIRGMCQQDYAPLAEIFVGRWDLIAVKALLRNRHHGVDAESGARSLVPGPSMTPAIQKEMSSLDSMDALVRGLAAWNPKLCRGLVDALPGYQESKNLRVLEEALDRAYFVRNVMRLESFRSFDANLIRAMLRAEIDRINLRRWFVPRAPGAEAVEIVRELLPRGRIGEQTLREIATAGSPERAAEIVGRTPYGDLSEGLARFAETGKFSALERQFELKLLDKLRGAVQRQGIGLASLLRYAWLKYNEVTNLRIIAHGLAARLPKARVEQEVLHV